MRGERTRYYQTRPRRIPPEFCTDELLESCSLLAALLLYRLISQADDQGRLPGHPRSIRATCFPMRSKLSERALAGALDELVRAGFLIRYDYRGRVLLQIDRWFDLQGKWGQRRTYPSRYPGPAGWKDWVNAGTDEDEVPALGPQDARDLRPPVPLSSAPSSGLTFTQQEVKGASADHSLERIDKLIEKAKRDLLTPEDAYELGAALASDQRQAQTRRRA